MIDEFQDTSTIQWQNFKVLLEETMSRENAGNLIVGDVKQSIYRWRSGDWRLLNNIEKEFGETKSLEMKTLDTNYRSDRNIIAFNNAFFVEAAKQECEMLKGSNQEQVKQLVNAYADVCQQVPEKKGKQGYVDVQLLGGEDTTESMMKQSLEIATELTAMGVPANKIAILVRSNKAIQDIAAYFMENSDFMMVSDEAFRLDASQAVSTLVVALRLMACPEDAIAKAILAKYAIKYLGNPNIVEKILSQRETLLEKPLFELTEILYAILEMDKVKDMKKQSAYVCAFYDKMNEYLVDNSSNIDAFLKEWDNTIHEKSIHCDGINGIRLITIHKSKGLEFDYVIMPFCDWKLEKMNTIWCEPQEEPFNELPLVPIDFNAKTMMQSIYEPDYHHEHLQNVVDNLNLLYVAFTRASHSLFVLGKRGNQNSRAYLIESVLQNVARNLEGTGVPVELSGIGSESSEDIDFSYGELIIEKEKTEMKKESDNVFLKDEAPVDVVLYVNPELPEFKQSNKSRDFVEGDEAEEQQKFYIKMGTVLHSIFSSIKTSDDVESALKQLEIDGILYDDNVSNERLEKMIKQRLASPQVKDWFSNRWRVLNECSIVKYMDGKAVKFRPDRVMKDGKETVVVDFKFGKPKEEHQEQVRGYMDLLREMGYQNITGYLWYVYPNKVVEVK